MARLNVRFPVFGFDTNSEDGGSTSEDNFGCTPAISTPDMPDTILLSLKHSGKKLLDGQNVSRNVSLEDRSDESVCSSGEYAASPRLAVPDKLPEIILKPISSSISTSEQDDMPSSPCLEIPDRLPVVELKYSSTKDRVEDETHDQSMVKSVDENIDQEAQMADGDEDNGGAANDIESNYQHYIEPTYFENHDDYYPVVEPTYNDQDDWDESHAQSRKMSELLSGARSEQQNRIARAPLSIKNLNISETTSTKKKRKADAGLLKPASSGDSRLSSQSVTRGPSLHQPMGSTLTKQNTAKRSSKNVSRPGRQMSMLTFVAKPKTGSIQDPDNERWLPRLK